MPAQAMLITSTVTLNCNLQISTQCGAHWHDQISATSTRYKGKMVDTTEQNTPGVSDYAQEDGQVSA